MAAPIAVNVVSAREELRRYVNAALFRLRTQEALRALTVVVFVSLFLLMAVIIIDRLCSLSRVGINLYMIWACITALGIPYVLWRTWSPRLHEDLASVLADDRLKLNSRLSTALTLDLDDPQNAAFSEAFFAEALGRLQGLKVETAFPIKTPKGAPFAILPLLACGALYQWMPFQDQLGLIAKQEQKKKAEQIQEKMAKKLDGKLEDLKRKVEEHTDEQYANHKLTQLLEKADQISKELKDGKRNPEEAVIGLGQLKREIHEEQEKLTQGKEFLDRLEKLKAENLNLEDTALTRDVSEALKMGDPGLAARELRKLSQKIKDDILNDASKTDAEKKAQLDKLKKEVEKLAGALAEDEALRDQLQELSKKTMEASEFEALQEEIQKQLERQGKGSKKLGDDLQKELEDVAEELERLEEDNDAKLNEDEQEQMDQLEAMEEGVDEALQAEEGGEGEGEGQQGEGQQGGQQAGGQPGKGKKKAKKGQGSGNNMKGKGRMARGQGGQ
ncbi:MAG TPA: hypothetical protein VEJ63_19605, partial [Planctomycetota bacterium]|nr:hypothetical protein [Planctomycetota bacterium]